MQENKKFIKSLLKELVEIFEENYTLKSDMRISDIYYLLSLYSLEIISFEKLQKESFQVLEDWSKSECCGHNPFYIQKETSEETRRINKEWTEIVEKLCIEFKNLV